MGWGDPLMVTRVVQKSFGSTLFLIKYEQNQACKIEVQEDKH